jgi:hypothetical protein
MSASAEAVEFEKLLAEAAEDIRQKLRKERARPKSQSPTLADRLAAGQESQNGNSEGCGWRFELA